MKIKYCIEKKENKQNIALIIEKEYCIEKKEYCIEEEKEYCNEKKEKRIFN